MRVYVLVREQCEYAQYHSCLIGVYSSLERAEEAARRDRDAHDGGLRWIVLDPNVDAPNETVTEVVVS